MGEFVSSQRERSKARRRLAIQRSGLRLFAERGYDGATVADIAADAEVAVRMVSMYFPTKLDLALSAADDVARRLTAVIEENPELTFTDAIDRWLSGEIVPPNAEMVALTSAMFVRNPELRQVSAGRSADDGAAANAALLAQLGLAADDDMVRIVSASIGGALSEYFTTILPGHTDVVARQRFMRYLRTMIYAAGTG